MIALRWGFAIGTIDFFPVSRRELSLHHNRTNIFPGCFTWNIAAYVGIFAHTTKLPEIDASNVANHCSSIGLPQTSDNIKLYSIMFTWNIAFLWSKLCAINRTFPGRRSLTSAKHKRGGFRYLTTRTVAFHTVSRDTSIYLSWFKNTGIQGLTPD